MWNNPGLNQAGMWQWPTHQKNQFKQLVNQNQKRIAALSNEQMVEMDKLAWSVEVDHDNNNPDALNEARHCKVLLDIVTKK